MDFILRNSYLFEEILSYLDIEDLLNCQLVCKQWYIAVNSDKLWKRICQEEGVDEENWNGEVISDQQENWFGTVYVWIVNLLSKLLYVNNNNVLGNTETPGSRNEFFHSGFTYEDVHKQNWVITPSVWKANFLKLGKLLYNWKNNKYNEVEIRGYVNHEYKDFAYDGKTLVLKDPNGYIVYQKKNNNLELFQKIIYLTSNFYFPVLTVVTNTNFIAITILTQEFLIYQLVKNKYEFYGALGHEEFGHKFFEVATVCNTYTHWLLNSTLYVGCCDNYIVGMILAYNLIERKILLCDYEIDQFTYDDKSSYVLYNRYNYCIKSFNDKGEVNYTIETQYPMNSINVSKYILITTSHTNEQNTIHMWDKLTGTIKNIYGPKLAASGGVSKEMQTIIKTLYHIVEPGVDLLHRYLELYTSYDAEGYKWISLNFINGLEKGKECVVRKLILNSRYYPVRDDTKNCISDEHIYACKDILIRKKSDGYLTVRLYS